MPRKRTIRRQAPHHEEALTARAIACSAVLALALSGFVAGTHAAVVAAGETAADQPPAVTTRPAEIRGLSSALRDPSEKVRDAVADYPATVRVLPAVVDLEPEEIEKLVGLWLREPTASRIRIIAVHPDFAAATAPKIAGFLAPTASGDPGTVYSTRISF